MSRPQESADKPRGRFLMKNVPRVTMMQPTMVPATAPSLVPFFQNRPPMVAGLTMAK